MEVEETQSALADAKYTCSIIQKQRNEYFQHIIVMESCLRKRYFAMADLIRKKDQTIRVLTEKKAIDSNCSPAGTSSAGPFDADFTRPLFNGCSSACRAGESGDILEARTACTAGEDYKLLTLEHRQLEQRHERLQRENAALKCELEGRRGVEEQGNYNDAPQDLKQLERNQLLRKV